MPKRCFFDIEIDTKPGLPWLELLFVLIFFKKTKPFLIDL